MKISLLKLKKIIGDLEKGANGITLSKIDIEFWLKEKGKNEPIELSLERVGQFSIKPDATFHFKKIKY